MKNDKFQENLSRPGTGPRPGGWETLPYAACIQLYPPEDEHLKLESCKGI